MIGETRPAPNHSVRTPRPEHGFTLSSAGLLTCGSVLDASLPSFPVAYDGVSRSAHSCGGSHGFGPDWVVRTVFPFNPLESIRRGTYDVNSIAPWPSLRQAGGRRPCSEMLDEPARGRGNATVSRAACFRQPSHGVYWPVTDDALDLAMWQPEMILGQVRTPLPVVHQILSAKPHILGIKFVRRTALVIVTLSISETGRLPRPRRLNLATSQWNATAKKGKGR
jgi:hypothetical protein